MIFAWLKKEQALADKISNFLGINDVSEYDGVDITMFTNSAGSIAVGFGARRFIVRIVE